MKHRLIVCALVFTMALLTAQSALAARVYNFTPITLKFAGSKIRSAQGSFALASGQRSESVNYPNWARIDVEDPSAGVTYCAIVANGDLQGGNYLVVWHVGNKVHCALCGSSHNVMKSGAGNAPYHWEGQSRTGC